MDQFLSLILALLAFTFLIFMIQRAVKLIILVGIAVIAFLVLTASGVFG